MLRPRIIPNLLIHDGGLVKTRKFRDHKYVGDPINAVRIFNEKKVDELIITDIDVSINGIEPDYDLISKLASECRMPLCYSGGVKTTTQIEKIISLGVEKVALSSSIISSPEIILAASKKVGRQSLVAVLDLRKSKFFGKYEIFINNGREKINVDPFTLATKFQDLGIGEILINMIDLDGTLKGYDISFIEKLYNKIDIPLTVLGGAGSLLDIKELFDKFGIIGAAAGSLFVFKGKYRAVLIQYPEIKEKDLITNIFNE